MAPGQMPAWYESIRNRHFFLIDVLLLIIASVLTFVLHWGQIMPLGSAFFWFTGLSLVLKLSNAYRLGVYRRYWFFAGPYEVMSLMTAVAQASVLSALIIYAVLIPLRVLENFPWPVIVIDMIVAYSVMIGARLGIRKVAKLDRRYHSSNGNTTHEMERILVVGTSAMGAMLVTEMQDNPDLGMYPIGFVDTAPHRQQLYIRNVPVLGTLDEIEDVVRAHEVDQIVVAWPSAPGKIVRDIVQAAEKSGVSVGIAPDIAQVLDGQVTCSFVRQVEVEDLLRREPVQTDMERVRDMLAGQRVLITGAGGSIGSEICRQVVKCKVSRLILLGHGENSLYTISNELAQSFPGLNMSVVIADIRDQERLELIFERERPDGNLPRGCA